MSEKKKAAFWTIAGLIVTGFLVAFALKNLESLESTLRSSGVWAPLIIILLYVLFSLTPVPTDSLTIISGAVFGIFFGTLIATVGNTLAALMEYFFGLKVRDATGTKGKTFKIPIIKKQFPINSIPFLIFGRFLPGYGGKIVSIMGGMYKVPLWRYTWTAAFSNLCGALMFSYGGHILRFFVRK